MISTSLEFDPHADNVVTFNDTDIDTNDALKALGQQHPELKSLSEWARNSQNIDGIFSRDRYSSPRGVFSEIRIAQEAVENDDTVSGVADTTEQIAFNRVEIECEDPDEQDIWNQILDDLQIEKRMREMWREVFTTSNTYVASLKGRKSYKVRGKTDKGTKKKKEFNDLIVPTGISVLDPLRMLPIGNFMFSQERLAYIATRGEGKKFKAVLTPNPNGERVVDLVVSQLLTEKYEPSNAEKQEIKNEIGEDVELSNLFLMDPERVFRITSTRPQYQRFAAVRMKSVFELLDMKSKLRAMDRAHLVGATNFIILVTMGSDDHMAKPEELGALSSQVRVVSRVPIIVGNHTLKIEIVTPKLDKTLSPERYNALDARITSRLYQVFSAGNYASGTANDDSIKLLRVVARSMEARRNNIRDEFFRNVIKPTFEANDKLTTVPRITFYPRRISLDFDQNVAVFLQALRDGGDISRETILAELDLVQSEEAQKREYETEHYDKFFPKPVEPGAPLPENQPAPTKVDGVTKKAPAKAPAAKKVATAKPPAKTPAQKRQAGATRGGNRNGGGSNLDSGRSQPGRGPAT